MPPLRSALFISNCGEHTTGLGAFPRMQYTAYMHSPAFNLLSNRWLLATIGGATLVLYIVLSAGLGLLVQPHVENAYYIKKTNCEVVYVGYWTPQRTENCFKQYVRPYAHWSGWDKFGLLVATGMFLQLVLTAGIFLTFLAFLAFWGILKPLSLGAFACLVWLGTCVVKCLNWRKTPIA